MAKLYELGTSFPPEKVVNVTHVGWVMVDRFGIVICDEWGEVYRYDTREAAETAMKNYVM